VPWQGLKPVPFSIHHCGPAKAVPLLQSSRLSQPLNLVD